TAVADLAPFRAAYHTDFANAVRREVVMQHERFFALALDGVDDLRIAFGAQGRHHQRLRFATGEKCGTMGTRQHTSADRDGTHRAGIAAIDARFAREDAAAHDL